MEETYSNLEEINKQTIQDKNKELIDEVRKNSNKPKKNNSWMTIAWCATMCVFTIGVIVAIYLATRPIPVDPIENYINVSITTDDFSSNAEVLAGLKFPQDSADYNLFVTNDKQSYTPIYLRYYATTIIDGVPSSENIITLNNLFKNYYYDEEVDKYYHVGKLDIGEVAQICTSIQISGAKTKNEHSGAKITFTITVDAVKADEENIWSNAPAEWLELIN